MQKYNFRYVFVLTGMHFLFGGVSLKFISVMFKSFTPKEIPLGQRFLVGASGVGSIALMNFSLQTNSVGTYQLMKVREWACIGVRGRVCAVSQSVSLPARCRRKCVVG